MTLRSPIISVLGHVDHGKSSILDAIRGSNILATEAGKITQAIGASIIPLDTIKQRCGALIEQMQFKFTLPGLLFIDTPGHAAFTTLRKRGGALADIAVVTIDLNEGFKPQTKETIDILRAAKTPFIIAANKIDLAPGFRITEGSVLKQINEQASNVQQYIDTKIYEIVGTLYKEYEIQAERFDRVDDFTKSIAIIPCSALKNIGVSELLVMIAGIAQKFLEKNLKIELGQQAKGSILEVKEDKGLGKTIDVILYDGTLRIGDTIVLGGLHTPLVTKIRGLFEPAPLSEMRDKKSEFISVKEVSAATGVKISAPGLDGAMAGTPLLTCTTKTLEETKAQIQEDLEDVLIETEKEGIIIKADTIGSLEALTLLLKDKDIPIRKAQVGPISRKDIADAESNFEKDPLQSVILGFNIPPETSTDKVKIITHAVIYKLIEDFEEWQEEARAKQQAKKLEKVTRPCRIEVLQNCIFRQSNPVIVGVEIMAGTLKTGMSLTKDGSRLAIVKSMQKEKDNVNIAEKGTQLAISLPGIMAGRHIAEGDILYSLLSEEDFRKCKEYVKFLSGDEKGALKEIASIMRDKNPVWGV